MNKAYFNIFTLFALILSNAAFSQNSTNKPDFSISGKVVDSKNNPLEYTTVSLHNKIDSSLVTGSITDAAGNFTIEATPGTFWLEVQFISYQTKKVPNITVSKESPHENVGAIVLTDDSQTLSEVVVAGEKQQMELSLDKRVFNVSNDLTNRGRNASEILDNVPSVAVDVEGNVSLRGSNNVRILVDGKPSGLVGLSSPDALRMLQGDLIERIEVITNPSARYEAEGMAGIINIILKKERRNGLNGSITANVGIPSNYGVSLNVNVRRKWLNLFSSYGINYRESPGSGKSNQIFYGDEFTTYTDRTQDRIRSGLSHNFRIGSDFYINENNTLTASMLYRISDEENTSEILYNNRYSNMPDLVSTTLRKDKEIEDESNWEYELNYDKTFKKEDQKLTASVQYRAGGETEKSNIDEIVLSDGSGSDEEPLFQRSLNKENSENFLFQTDYVHPFNKEGKFEVGLRSTFRIIETEYRVEELQENEQWINLEGFTNQFNYDEAIHAFYGIIGNKVNNFSYQAGLRAEYTDITTELLETNERNDKDYFSLFPSAHLTYELKNDNSLQASYSRRLNRPNFWNLNPFTSFSDARNIRTGNPDLDPDFTNSFEVGYLKNWPKSSVYSGAYYRQTTDVIQWLSRAEGDTTYTRPENFGTMDAYGVETNYSQDLASWWKINLNANFYRAITTGTAFEEKLESDTYTFSGRLNSKITLWDAVQFQQNVNYRAPEETPQGRRKAFYTIDLALNKDIFQGKGSLTLSVRDLLNSRKWRNETFGDNFYSESEFQWRARQVTFSFSYRLNQKKAAQREGEGGNYEGGGEEGF